MSDRARHGVAAITVVLLVALVAACSANRDEHNAVDASQSAGTTRTAPTLLDASTTPTTPPPPATKPTLYGGEHNDQVAEMQRVLKFRGYDVPQDGVFGDSTAAAIKQYQQANGLFVDGVIGDDTWLALAFPHPTVPPPPTTAPPPTAPAPVFLMGPVNHAVVKLATQQVELYDGPTLKGRIPVSTGANGATPRGSFTVFRRVPRATADSDPLVTMPWLVNFNGGIGFHGIPVKGSVPLPTPLGQYPVSHGCIRMADANAKFVFDNLQNGARVDVV